MSEISPESICQSHFQMKQALTHMTRPTERSPARRDVRIQPRGAGVGVIDGFLNIVFMPTTFFPLSLWTRLDWKSGLPPLLPPGPLHFYMALRLIAMSCGVTEDICVSDNMLTVITTHN